MKRRTLLQSLAAAFTTTRLWPSAAVRAQNAASLTDANIAALAGIAEVVLPSSLDAANRDARALSPRGPKLLRDARAGRGSRPLGARLRRERTGFLEGESIS